MEMAHVHIEQLGLDNCSKVLIKFYKNVKNAAAIKKRVLKGHVQAALLKPALVCDSFSIIVAANKANNHLKLGKMKTKNVHTELIYNLSPTHSISDSLVKFGSQDKDEEIVIACIYEKEKESEVESYFNEIEGESCPLEEISNFSDEELIKKVYKVTDQELKIGTLADAIVCRISTKDAS